jgi:cellulose biosynthesis protein BcsQ
MAVIAIFSPKGGVGKSTIATNLGWCSAQISRKPTLLWELDPQRGASYLLGEDEEHWKPALSIFSKDRPAKSLITATEIEGLDLLPSDGSMVELDSYLRQLGKKRRLAKIAQELKAAYPIIILDCPPVMNEVARQIMRAADLIIVPLSPSPLARRSLDLVRFELSKMVKSDAAILPVFSMIDRRRSLHREACDAQPDWPVIPMSSIVEQVAVRRAPLGAFRSNCPASVAFASLWRGIEAKLASRK